MTSSKEGFFYIIKTSDTPENVYKIGKTTATNPNKRLCDYPQYSIVFYTIAVKNIHIFEKIVIHKLKGRAVRHMEFGYEYYEADIKHLINCVHNIWMSYGHIDIDIYSNIKKNQPTGWQYFANEWLAKNIAQEITPEFAYENYVKMIKESFGAVPCKYDKFEIYYYSVMY